MGAHNQEQIFKEFEFHVDGVHCANCLRKIDGLSETLAPIESLNFDMSHNRLSFKGPQSLSNSTVLQAVESLGFQGREYSEESVADLEAKKTNRKHLIRLGVAAVSAGNIMLLASSIYSGAEGLEARFMNWIMLLLAIPALTYGAWPIYRTAWADLKLKKVSVDLPIVVAIIAGSVLSTISVIQDRGDIYFDSITCLIFLLLASRYFLNRVQARYLGVGRLQNLFKIHKVKKLNADGSSYEVEVEALRSGDIVEVESGQVLPVDGELLGSQASLDTSLLSGESRPRGFAAGEQVYMGMKNCGAAITLKVSQSFEKSRINKMLQEVETAVSVKPRSIALLDRVGQTFLVLVMLAATATVLYFWGTDPMEGVRRALALILVACPCTFAFGAPMVFSLGMVRAAKDGLLIKHPSVFEKIDNIKSIIFDKTGTLTDGRYELIHFAPTPGLSSQNAQRILSLVSQSEHPVSKAIRIELLNRGVQVTDENWIAVKEIPTKGLIGEIEGQIFEVNSERVTLNGKVLLSLSMGDQIWPEAKAVVQKLGQNKDVYVLSGDSEQNVKAVSQELGIDPENCFSKQSPEMKNEFLKQHSKALMLGDGANDSLALAKAYVGVAANGSLSSSLRASDVYLMKQDLSLLVRLTALSARVRKIIRQNLSSAVLYNIVVGGLAIAGFIHPLLAAVLMPISSLTQLLSALRVLKKQGEAWT